MNVLARNVRGRRVPALAMASRTVSARPAYLPAQEPGKRFSSLGCVGCHGKGSRCEAALQQARHKPADQLARWIRNPEAFLPGTIMPTFAPVLDEAAAMELAEWTRGDGPSRLANGG